MKSVIQLLFSLLILNSLNSSAQTEHEYIQLGNKLMDSLNFENAIIAYNSAIEINPKSAIAYGNIGSILNQSKQYRKAIEYFKHAVDLDSTVAIVYYNYGNSFYELHIYDSATIMYSKAIQLKQKYGDPHAMLGIIDIVKEDYKKAIPLFQAALKYKTLNEMNVYYGLGYAYFKTNKFKESIDAYTKYINSPGTKIIDAYFYRSRVFMYQKKYEEALKDYQTIQLLDSSQVDEHMNMCGCLYNLNRYEEALVELNKVIEKDANHTAAYLLRGRIYSEQDKNTEACIDIQKAIELGSEEAKELKKEISK